MKIRHIKAYKIKDCPDHIQQEFEDYLEAFKETIAKYDLKNPALLLSAVNHLHAIVFQQVISENDYKNAIIVEMRIFLMNLNNLLKIDIDKLLSDS